MRWLWQRKWLFFIAVTSIGLAIDLWTKHLAVANLTMGRPVPVIGDFFQLLLVYNRNAVFGLDPRKWIPGLPLNTVFYIFSGIAVVVLLTYYNNVGAKDRLLRWGVALIMPGALGNLTDRALHAQRGVVDFVRVGISERVYWPIFNMADVYVTVGVGLILVALFLEDRKVKTSAPQVTSVNGAHGKTDAPSEDRGTA